MWKKKNKLTPIQINKNEDNGAQLKVEELRIKNGRNKEKEKDKRRESNTRRKCIPMSKQHVSATWGKGRKI
jgi:hypothetical protein